jgi:hypothetical protein
LRSTIAIDYVSKCRIEPPGIPFAEIEKWLRSGRVPKRSIAMERSKFLRMKSAPVGIRTSNLLIRSQMLYPVELRAPGKR